jgi:sulfate adenylyltransferase subunit 1
MDRETLHFVIVGHVDHGKSTLIGRLLYDTGSLPREKMEEIERVSRELGRTVEFAFAMDHMEEERDQGITIDTAQTFFRTARREYVIIDAPGHKEFLRNMITGASQAEAALLIIDAAEGVREQTRRHAYLLGMLGVRQIVVLVNKMDKVAYAQERFDAIAAEFTRFLGAVKLSPTHVIPISASQGENVVWRSSHMPWYSGATVVDALDTFAVPPDSSNRPLRFPVQDVYRNGDRRILVGRVEAGALRVGDRLAFLPSGNDSRIATIERWPASDRPEASTGESIGLTLDDALFVERGMVAAPPDSLPAVVHELRASVFSMSPVPLKAGERLSLRLATQEVSVSVSEISRRIDSSTLDVLGENASELRNNEIGEVILRSRKPFVAESFGNCPELGRFVLCRGRDVVAGGIIPAIA